LYVGALALTLSTPFFLAAAGVGALGVGRELFWLLPAVQRRGLNRAKAAGELVEAPPYGNLRRAFNDMQEACGLKDVGFYVANRPNVDAQARARHSFLGRLYRKYAHDPAERDSPGYAESISSWMRVYFVAHSRSNYIATTEAALRNYSLAEKKLLVAHELAHIKAGDYNGLHAVGAAFVRETRGIIGWAGLPLVMGLPVVGVSNILPWLACVAAGSLAQAGMMFASREMEKRTDRNAIYLTRDIGAAERKIKVTWDSDYKPGLRQNYHASHPIGRDRLDNYRAAFEEAADYPKLPYKSFVHDDTPSKFARGRKPGVTAWGETKPL
jgi:Zn-dependent protease with chaperone function